MTELLHPVHNESPTNPAVDASGTGTPPPDPSPDGQAPEGRASRSEREGVAPDGTLAPEDLAALSTRQLRVIVNEAYRLMDTHYPPVGAIDRYEMIVEELRFRARQAAGRDTGYELKETFRDNPLYCRFELIIDGTIAAYLRYTMNGAQLVLTDGVEQPGFRDQGIDATLMRHVVLNAHKRRLGLVPQCPMAFSFLADNPQYQVLTGQPRH